ncbi:hypothetical protein BD410DRAFT_824639 [Rickenella mellea]|uniref:Uncharacterized protein n=1 Tax=Rickenella mellea TaxID=50990 RepID=A0A4Y7QLV2_9AGAM|nr:hypothetical protein BD410DRAFT_824639 [Rickenella mellea]
MAPVCRLILPKSQILSANANTGVGMPSTVQRVFRKNPAPCANCSSAQQACLVHPPYSPDLCKKCARERRDKCPAHMHRIDAILWKKMDVESRQAADAQPAPTTQAAIPMEDPSDDANVNIVFVQPEITPPTTSQLQNGEELHTDDVFERSENDTTTEQHHDDVVFNFDDSDQQIYLTAMFTTDDNLQYHISPTEDAFQLHVSAFVEDFAFLPVTDNDTTHEIVSNSNELYQQFDLTAMFTMDDNTFSPEQSQCMCHCHGSKYIVWSGSAKVFI